MFQNIFRGIPERQEKYFDPDILAATRLETNLTKFTTVLEKRMFLDSFLRNFKIVFKNSHKK